MTRGERCDIRHTVSHLSADGVEAAERSALLDVLLNVVDDTMEAIDHIIPFLKGDADMIGLVCNTIRKLFCMSDEGYEIFLMNLEEYKAELEEEDEE